MAGQKKPKPKKKATAAEKWMNKWLGVPVRGTVNPLKKKPKARRRKVGK